MTFPNIQAHGHKTEQRTDHLLYGSWTVYVNVTFKKV